MSAYVVLKTVHILSATVLFGTGLGIAYFKWSTDRTRDVRAIRAVSERVVVADWLFTLPSAIVQPTTGLAAERKIIAKKPSPKTFTAFLPPRGS